MLPGVLKAKLFVSEYGWSVVVALALVGVVCLAGAGWALATPPTETHTVQTDQRTFSSEVTTSALVTNGSSVWREGTHITDAPVYLLSATPNLTLEQRIGVPKNESVGLNRTIAIEYRAQHDGRTFWRTREPITTDTRTTTDGGFKANTSLDVRRIQDRKNGLERVLSDAGTVEPYVVVNVSYKGSQYAGTLGAVAPLNIESDTYSLGGGLDANKTRSTPVTRTQTGSVGPFVVVPLIVLGAGCLVAAGLVGRLLRRGVDAKALRHRLHEGRYAEWLSAGAIPKAAGTTVRMDSLEDLVDVAIDSDKRAIHDRSRGQYAVLDGDVRYCYGETSADHASADDASTDDDHPAGGMSPDGETTGEPQMDERDGDGRETDAHGGADAERPTVE